MAFASRPRGALGGEKAISRPEFDINLMKM
jgi:hypothetical protein